MTASGLVPGLPNATPRAVLVSATAGGLGHSDIYLEHLAASLQGNDFRVVVVAPADFAPKVALGDRVRRISVDARGAAQAAARFKRLGPLAGLVRGLVRNSMSRRVLDAGVRTAEDGDLVHFIDYEYMALIRALAKLESRKVRTAVTLHPADFDGSTGGLGGIYKRTIRASLGSRLRRTDLLLTHGPWIQARVARQLGLDDDPASSGPKLVHRYYPSGGYGPSAFQDRSRRDDPAVEVLWFGMIRRNKRLNVAMDVMSSLPDRFRLHIAGHPAEVSVDEIRSWVQARGIADRVRLTLKYLDDAEADNAFERADLLLATHDTRFASASGPIADARCYGVPVVVPGAGQLADYVRRMDVGAVAVEDTVESIAATVLDVTRRLRQDPDWQKEILAVARELDWGAFGDAHAQAFRSVLDTTTHRKPL